jgi:hypothetical protein
MYGPRPAGFWARASAAKPFKHLVPGQRYAVTRPFIDYDGDAHPLGETWWYRGYNYSAYDSGLSLFVSVDGKDEWHIRLEDRDGGQLEVVRALEQYLTPVLA